MSFTSIDLVIGFLLVVGADADGGSQLRPDVETFVHPAPFENATRGLGKPTIVDFDDIEISMLGRSHWSYDPFDGSYYTDSAYSNANVSHQELSLGGKSMRKTVNGYKYFSSKFAVTRTDERYYDRDDGSDQFAGPDDVSSRLGRTRFGPRVYYHRKRGAFGYGLRADAFISEYAETLDYLDLTHEQYLAGVHVSYDPLRNTQLRLSYDHSERQYDQRKAKTIGGIRFTSNDELNYLYDSIGGSLRQKLGSGLAIYLDYQFTERSDQFEAYDDYERHTGRVRAR